MSDETQGNGSTLAEPAAQPSGTETAPKPTEDLNALKGELDKAKGDLGKIREFYSQYPKAVSFLKKYVDDPSAQTLVDKYLETGTVNLGNGEETDELPIDERTNRVLTETQARLKDQENQLNQLRQTQLKAQIDEWRRDFTVEKGFPVNFKEVENEIADMITNGKAIDAISAYKMIGFEKSLKGRSEIEKQLKNYKIQASMSRGSVPRTMSVRGANDKKSLSEAWQEAVEDLGIE